MARSSAATRRQALRSCSTTRRWQVWQDDERVRAGELELLHDAFELDRIFLIEHRERVMRQGGAARGDEGTAHQYSHLPSRGVSPC